MFQSCLKANLWRVLFFLASVAVLSGCPASLNRVPGSTEEQIEAQTGEKYLLYVPSWHTNDQRWPLVVTCHGTEPFDTAELQLREWRGLAERVGFLVAAPCLKGTDGITVRSHGDQMARQQADERLILNIVRNVTGSLNADPHRIYIVGWSGGGYAVYHTGLRNPSVFRAAAVRMGSFKKDYLPDMVERTDVHQPVAIFYGSEDILPGINAESRQAYDYLKSLGMKRLMPKELTGGHRRRPEVAFDFFKDVTSKYAYVKPSAITGVGDDPLAVQFYLDVDPEPKVVWWEFGDGVSSSEPSPRHVYPKAGSYLATVHVVTMRSARTDRQMTIEVGR